ncbi:YidC/Oxa1 family membrane protein insertase, partial [Patescibacteria group bacterium]|nr:YidC/Oxa1 family membrane protein insertase [Patescibacteria group bacterium]
MADLFHTIVYEPIYNALAFFINLIPGGDVGLAIVAVTVLVRLVLFPISWTAIKTQMTMRQIDPVLKEMREKYKDNKEELARKMMDLFKTHKINPFASFLLILIQLPVVIGLYLVLQEESKVLAFDPAILYSFIAVPTETTLQFLGLLNLSEKSILLAVIVAATQYIFAKLMMPPVSPKKEGTEPSFADDLQRSMSLQMQYVFPVLLGVVAYATSASI